MAFVIAFEEDDRDLRGMQPTKVVCRYISREYDGKRLLQLNTYGSSEREVPGKLSQTLQLDEAGAKALYIILQKEFGFR